MATDSSTSTRLTKQELATQNRIYRSALAIHAAAGQIAARQAAGIALHTILNELARECSSALSADIFCILTLTPDGNNLTVAASVGLEIDVVKPIPVHDRNALPALAQKEFTALSGSRTGTCMIMTFQDLPLGAICIARSSRYKALTEPESKAVRHVADQLAATLFMYGPARDIMEMERTEREIQMAHSLSRSLTPRIPRLADLRIDAASIRCLEFGGDFYDAMSLASGRAALLIGETSGSGLKAALTLTRMNGIVRGMFARQLPLSDILTELNRELVEIGRRGQLVSICILEINPATKKIRIGRAGSTEVLFCDNGDVRRISETTCPQLGVLSMIHPPVTEVQMKPGCSLLLVTDGMNKIFKPGQDPLTLEHLKDEMTAPRDPDLSLSQRVVDRISEYMGADVPEDDLSILSIESML